MGILLAAQLRHIALIILKLAQMEMPAVAYLNIIHIQELDRIQIWEVQIGHLFKYVLVFVSANQQYNYLGTDNGP